jgi:heterodisulfide reductase subunit A-like polyferredoxin
MQKNIIRIKAEQKLTRIIIANITPKSINNVFNKLIRKLTIIANLFTLRRKPKISKGCPWWYPAINNATARAKQEYRSYIAAPTNPKWKNYKATVALEKRPWKKLKRITRDAR